MSSIREFNRGYTTMSIGQHSMSSEQAVQLHILMLRTICKLDTADFNEHDMDVVTLLTNIHEIIQKSPNNADVIWGCVDTLNKTVTAISNKEFVINRLRVLPILADMLEISTDGPTTECILKILYEITFGVKIPFVEPFLENLLQKVVGIIMEEQDHTKMDTDSKPKYNQVMQTLALSVLINVCCNNIAPLSLLSQQINFVDFQKQVSIKRYGILACKANLILNDCGHLLTEADIRNFLQVASKEVLKCMTDQNEATLKHLIGFLRDMASRANTRHVLREYNFKEDFNAAIMVLENQQRDSCYIQISSLFELSSIILETKNQSLANMRITLLNFAQSRISTPNCCVDALKTLIAIFEFDEHVSTTNFELSELTHSLMDILTGNEFKPDVMVPLLKLLIVLGEKYNVEILNGIAVNSILKPLIGAKELDESKLKSGNVPTVTMYLQCLVAVLKLSQMPKSQLNLNVLNEKNVQCIVAKAITNGNQAQRELALQLLKAPTFFPPTLMAERMQGGILESCDMSQDGATIQYDPSTMQCPPPAMKGDRLNEDDFIELFDRVQQACDDNKLNKLSVFDFVRLHEDGMVVLKQRIARLQNQMQILSKEITFEKHATLRYETTLMKCTAWAQSLLRSNELLMEDKVTMGKLNIELKKDYKAAKQKLMSVTMELKTAIKERDSRIETLENELKENDSLRSTIISLMQNKRKK